MTKITVAQPFPRPVGVAVIGCGRISPLHLKAIANQPQFAKLVAVVDPDLVRAEQAATEFGAVHSFATMAEALACDAVEAVVLCTPNAFHAAQAYQAMLAGRHVLVEKPFSETLDDAVLNAKLADETGLVLAAGHVARHGAAVRALQDCFGKYGKLRALDATWCVFWDGPQAPWWSELTEDQGLILSLFAPHCIDFVQMVMGDAEPLRLTVEAARHQNGWQAEDEVKMLIRYPDNVLASVHVSYNQRHVTNRRTVQFEHATCVIENGNELWIDGELIVAPNNKTVKSGNHLDDSVLHYFECQMREFTKAVRGLPSRSLLHADALRQVRLNRSIIAAAKHR